MVEEHQGEGQGQAPWPNPAGSAVRRDACTFTLENVLGHRGRAHSVPGAGLNVPLSRGQGIRRRGPGPDRHGHVGGRRLRSQRPLGGR